MKLIKFRRLAREMQMIDIRRIKLSGEVVYEKRLMEILRWETAENEAELWAKLNGEMAEIIIPAKSWRVRLWRRFFPLKMVEMTE